MLIEDELVQDIAYAFMSVCAEEFGQTDMFNPGSRGF